MEATVLRAPPLDFATSVLRSLIEPTVRMGQYVAHLAKFIQLSPRGCSDTKWETGNVSEVIVPLLDWVAPSDVPQFQW